MRQRGADREHGKADEERAPAERFGERFGRRRGREPADAAGGEVEAVQRGEAREREPERECLDRAHQARGHPQADERAAHRQHGEILRQRERSRTGRSDAEKRSYHAPGAVAVEQHAERELKSGEREEIHRGEKAELGRRELELACEVLRDDRVDVPVEERKEVARRERREHHEH
jgi:hypothetical protein